MGIEKFKFISFFTLLIVAPLNIALPIINRFIPTFGFFPFLLSLILIIITFPIQVTNSNWYPGYPDLAYVITLFLITFSLALYLFYFQRKFFIAVSVLTFTVNTSLIFMHDQNGFDDETIRDVKYSNFIPNSEMVSNPDIYLLTYDAYVAQETMMQYGIDNSEQEKYLTDKGFVLYPHTYSTEADTRSSMSRVLEISSSLRQFDGVYALAGNALVPSILKNHGYHTYGILGTYHLKAYEIGYDTFYPPMEQIQSEIYKGIHQGEFKFKFSDANSERVHEEFIRIKREVFTSHTEHPKFMYTHTGPHHSANFGRCRTDETALFEQRLYDSNIEMRQDIESILSTNRDSIIIINGDHGPYLTGDCFRLDGVDVSEVTRLDIQDRFGAFLAIRWPELNNYELIDIRVLQDTFEAVFGFLFQDKNILRKRVTTSIQGGGFITAIPANSVSDGKINVGIDAGEPLFESNYSLTQQIK